MTGPRPARRIDHPASVHDEREIEAVVEVLRGGPTALRIGRDVRAMEARVAELFAKRRGVMCDSGSSALDLAVEVLGLEPGDEVITSAVTYSSDVAPPRPSATPSPTSRSRGGASSSSSTSTPPSTSPRR
jgi:CDP-6-deoxy-D-xylo-4-hexulose-3-dehydrase